MPRLVPYRFIDHESHDTIRTMVIDVHCHMVPQIRRVCSSAKRFLFEPDGANGNPGFDAYLAPFLTRNPFWRFFANCAGFPLPRPDQETPEDLVTRVIERHWLDCPSVDRLVVLAFDEYHTDEGVAVGPIRSRRHPGSSMYTSNTLVHDICQRYPQRMLFGASIHPYRNHALEALDEVHACGAVLVKWLPITQNIDAVDPRTRAFVRRCGELNLPLLIHYGAEITLATQNARFQDPAPMLSLLSELRRENKMPPVIIAHVATPGPPFLGNRHFRTVLRALLGEFRDAPLYADIAALYQKPPCWNAILDDPRWRGIHGKLVWGSDFPIPPFVWYPYRRLWKLKRDVIKHPSWIERSYRICRGLGIPDEVFERAQSIIRH